MASGHSTITDYAMRTKGWLLVSEAARKIRVTPQTIYRWISKKKTYGFRDGYRRYVNWASVLKHIGDEAAYIRGLSADDALTETPVALSTPDDV